MTFRSWILLYTDPHFCSRIDKLCSVLEPRTTLLLSSILLTAFFTSVYVWSFESISVHNSFCKWKDRQDLVYLLDTWSSCQCGQYKSCVRLYQVRIEPFTCRVWHSPRGFGGGQPQVSVLQPLQKILNLHCDVLYLYDKNRATCFYLPTRKISLQKNSALGVACARAYPSNHRVKVWDNMGKEMPVLSQDQYRETNNCPQHNYKSPINQACMYCWEEVRVTKGR